MNKTNHDVKRRMITTELRVVTRTSMDAVLDERSPVASRKIGVEAFTATSSSRTLAPDTAPTKVPLDNHSFCRRRFPYLRL
jgi:hypothetical protein